MTQGFIARVYGIILVRNICHINPVDFSIDSSIHQYSVLTFLNNWLFFGSSGHVEQPKGLLTENFTRSEIRLDKHVKTFVRPDIVRNIEWCTGSPKSNFSFLNIFWLVCSCFHQSFVIKKFQCVHLLSVLELFFIFHLRQQYFFMFFVDSLQVVLLLLLVLEKGTSIIFPNFSLLRIDLLLFNLFLSFLLDLSSKIVSHLSFLLFRYLFTSLLLLLLLS